MRSRLIAMPLFWVAVSCLGAAIRPAAAMEVPDCPPPSPTQFGSPGLCVTGKWDSLGRAMSEFSFLYMFQNWARLERFLQANHEPGRVYDDGEFAPQAIIKAIEQQLPVGGITPMAAQQLQAWKKAAPDSAFVPIAEALFQRGEAWKYRGSGFANTVSPEAWQLFHEWLRKAEVTLDGAPAATKASPMWHQVRLTIALDSSRLSVSVPEAFNAAVAAFPEYTPFYLTMAARLVPKWGGSFAEVEALARTAVKNTKSTGAYARVYWRVVTMGYSPADTKVDWPTARDGFRELVNRFPNQRFSENYASFACWARDKKAWDEATARLDPRSVLADNWLDGHSYAACSIWAGQRKG